MKLKNKKTGEIAELCSKQQFYEDKTHLFLDTKNGRQYYHSLAELNAEWEDAPEEAIQVYLEGIQEVHSEGGRVFIDYATAKEAELAVRKFKAWKRLKDKGFRFTLTPGVGSLDITPGKFQIEINADMPAKWFTCDAVQEDLDICFGGEK